MAQSKTQSTVQSIVQSTSPVQLLHRPIVTRPLFLLVRDGVWARDYTASDGKLGGAWERQHSIHTTSVPSIQYGLCSYLSIKFKWFRGCKGIHTRMEVTMMFRIVGLSVNACDSECIVSVLQVWVEISCFRVGCSKLCYSLWDHLVLACPVQQLFIRGIEVATDRWERGTVLGCGIPNEREKREIDVWNQIL